MQKKVWLAVSLVLALTIAIGYSVWKRQNQPAPVVKDDKAEEVKKPEPQQKQKRGSLSFWCGEIIIGEDADEGKLELVGHKGEKSVILVAIEEGFFPFDSIPGIEKDEMYIRLQEEDGKPPMIFHSLCKEEQKMHPVYELTSEVKKGRIGPLILPHVVSPVQELPRQKGQKLEGPTWHLGSRHTQLYGE